MASEPGPEKWRSADYVGQLVGISGRNIRALAQRGVLTRDDKGQYPVKGSVLAYCNHMREQAAGRGQDGSTSGLTEQRKRLAQGQADKVELANQATRRELLSALEVETEWTRVIVGLRARMLAVVARVQQRLPHLTAPDVAAMDREIRDALSEAASEVTSEDWI